MNIAADFSVILAWWQLRDHIADHGFFAGLPYRAAALLLRGAYRKARNTVPDFDRQVRLRLAELSEKEAAQCTSLDEAAEPFAALLAALSSAEADETRRRILHQLFYHMGRWIYLIDAADDYQSDAKSGNYNPIRFRYKLREAHLTGAVRADLGATLDASIRRMAGAYALLEPGAWSALLDSIFYDSLYGIGKAVLDGVYHKPSRLRRARRAEGKAL